jgi:hypothetical protein
MALIWVENQDCDGQNTCAKCGQTDYHAEHCDYALLRGRTMGPSTKESKVFDAERLLESPLFDRKLF